MLHSVFQNHTYPGRIMSGAKHKQKIMALVKAEMVWVVERVMKSETVAQKVFGGWPQAIFQSSIGQDQQGDSMISHTLPPQGGSLCYVVVMLRANGAYVITWPHD